MNCFNHNELVAVSTCQDCNKGLCSECTSMYEIPICKTCNSKRRTKEKISIYKEILLSIVVGIIVYSIYKSESIDFAQKSFAEKAFSFYAFASMVSGWKFLTSITPSLFLTFKWIILYYFIKILISPLIGIFIFPIRIFKNTKRLLQLNKI